MNKNDLPNLGHLRETALAAQGLIAEVALAAAEDIEAAMPQSRIVTLPVTGWTGTAAGAVADRPQGSEGAAQAAPYSQTVDVAGILADEGAQMVQIVPAAASMDAWEAAGVRCTAQAAGKLTFAAKEKPGGSLKIFVVLQEVVG